MNDYGQRRSLILFMVSTFVFMVGSIMRGCVHDIAIAELKQRVTELESK